MVLISPASPAAHLVCPTCDFTEPSTAEPGADPAAMNISVSAASSVRSPTTVPVPWASTRPTAAGDTPAIRYARSSAACCPSRRGAVRPSDFPSLDPATALTTA